jgi:hypothetical protein
MATDVSDFVRAMDVASKQLPFAIARTVQMVGDEFQERQRNHAIQLFGKAKRVAWLRQSIKRTSVAKKNDPVQTYAVQTPGDPTRSDIIAQHETPGDKKPGPGRSAIVVPPKRESRPARDPSIAKYRFRKWGQGPTARVLVGEERTVMIRYPGGGGVVLQRRGKGGKLFKVAGIVPRARLKGGLNFLQNAVATVDETSGEFFQKAYADAIATAKGVTRTG